MTEFLKGSSLFQVTVNLLGESLFTLKEYIVETSNRFNVSIYRSASNERIPLSKRDINIDYKEQFKPLMGFLIYSITEGHSDSFLPHYKFYFRTLTESEACMKDF